MEKGPKQRSKGPCWCLCLQEGTPDEEDQRARTAQHVPPQRRSAERILRKPQDQGRSEAGCKRRMEDRQDRRARIFREIDPQRHDDAKGRPDPKQKHSKRTIRIEEALEKLGLFGLGMIQHYSL